LEGKSENITLDSTVQRHILQHVEGHVEVNTYVGDDGKVWVHEKYRGGDRCLEDVAPYYVYRRSELYVHPVTGILSKVVYPAPPKQEKESTHLIVSKDMHLAKIKGVWHRMEIREVPKALIEYCTKKRVIDEIIPPLNIHIPYDVYLQSSLRDVLSAPPTGPYRYSFRSSWNRSDLVRIYGRPDVYAHSAEQANKRDLRRYGLKNAA
jgi:hypothetical protein